MQLPQEILDRVNRVYEYHRSAKHTYQSVRQPAAPLDWANQPSPYRIFDFFAKVPLPTKLLDLPAETVRVLEHGLAALPDSQLNPPQTLQTLATWLHMADGLTQKKQAGNTTYWLRSCPSSGALYPFELYIAAFGIDGLEPGLYHFSPREFALRKLREGHETLSTLKRGRPELDFLKTVPAVLLVSTIYWRSAWKYGCRGYRYALLDAGHLVQNVIAAATGLGIPTVARLKNNDSVMRELIGVSADAEFGDAESVQAMVIWGAKAIVPLPSVPSGKPVAHGPLETIPREALSKAVTSYPSILAAHHDCVAPGLPMHEVRPPLTEMAPIPPEFPANEFKAVEIEPGPSLRQTLLTRRSTRDFYQRTISRPKFLTMNRVAFRGGTYFPLFPDGRHVGIVRPFWLVNGVTGIDSGIWYYSPKSDTWASLKSGEFHKESKYLALEQSLCGNASAVCFMMANLHGLMTHAGPDAYRLAHLEAGIVGQRLYLAAAALGVGASGIGAFYDDEVRKFFGLERTGWECIYVFAVGVPVDDRPTQEPIGIDETRPAPAPPQPPRMSV